MTNTEHHNPHIKYRRDIDGLRAIAILLVIIFHAFPKFLRGGFIGVDIFFVISGYLITGIILKGLNRDNFSLLEFYSRRIKRIFPALIVVLSFCLIAGWYVLLADEYEALGKHIAAGSIYISNFVLQSEAGYFDTDVELKPLLHLWSLAVEEQFYLFFPLLLILSHRLRINALGVIIIGFAISFALNVSQITDKPSEVFFYPQSRIWELLIGSAVAYISLQTHLLKARTQNIANFLSLFGLALILFAWVYLDSKKIFFPYYWALLPTLGATCLILAGDRAWFNRTILASKVAVFIGLISYPLYLWHWVLLSFIHITEVEKPKPLLKTALLFLSLFLAWLTYFLIERNIRFQKSKFVSIGMLFILVLIGLTGYIVKTKNGYPNRFNIEKKWNEGELGNEVFRNKELIFRYDCIKKFEQEVDEKSVNNQYCLIENIDVAPTALLIGDSHSNHLYSGLINFKVLTGGNLLNRGSGACFPFFDNPSVPNKLCPALIDGLFEMLKTSDSIQTVILSGKAVTQLDEYKFIPKNSVLNNDNDPYINFQNGMRKTLHYLSSLNKKIIFILDTPNLEFNPVACVNRPWRFDERELKELCAVPRSQVNSRRKKYLEIVMPILQDFPSVKVLDTLPAFCDDDYCWAVKDKKLLYRDQDHLNETGSIYLGEYFKHQK
jgi:peptidoglycan/LPS O-acetylase OafA/YrhL